MATVNFLYRSIRDRANLNVRLLYRFDSKDFVIGAKTKVEVSKDYWENKHEQKRPKDIEIANKQSEVNTEMNKIRNHILDEFSNINPAIVDNEWLKRKMNLYYYPPTSAKDLPNDLVSYFDVYLLAKKNTLKINTVKKYKVIKNLLLRYQEGLTSPLLIKDVDVEFQNNFFNYCLENGYAHNTIARALKGLKTVSAHALTKGIKVSNELNSIGLKSKEVKHIYLSLSELDTLREIKLNDRLDNARDWLIISCYTGQRVSDFMRFDTNMIRNEDGKKFIEFNQIKTGTKMTVPLHSAVLSILDKRKGYFPRPISDQKYNEYIKEVCKMSGLNELVEGTKKVLVNKGKREYRNKKDNFQKWELVTSHIGRRSFATNFYGKIPTVLLMNATGHKKESTFLAYIGKGNKDLAVELSKYF